MSCCSTSIDEARHERLKALADSINETARMARATLALLLTTALYLGFTLLSSTDENLLLNAQVAVPPQVGFGIALDKSYFFGPPIFLYLHVQGLFLLSVLYRKIQKFETALDQKLSGIPNSYRERQEYWSLLSAFAFVQLFRRNGHFPYVSRLLAWISIEAIPLALLFAVDLSFVRYQSWWITNSHHIIVLLALISVIWFNWRVSERGRQLRWGRIRFVLEGSLVLFLFSQAQPPSFDFKSVETIAQKKAARENTDTREIFNKIMEDKRNRIWRTGSEQSWQNVWKIMQGESVNVFDVILCKQLDLVCRYLNVNGLWLVSTQPADVFVHKMNGSGEDDSDSIRWSNLNKFSLADRSLLFADLRFSELQGANLEGVQLQGANLHGANLQHANLSRAILDEAFLFTVKLQYAILSEAKLRRAYLGRANLHHAGLANAQLQNAYFADAKLPLANLVAANLQGAYMECAQMDGTSLWGAKLTGSNLKEARLRGTSLSRAELLGTNFQNAQLQGANLRMAILQGVNLKEAQLEGADLYGADIKCSFGRPESWKFAWMRDASTDVKECTMFLDELDRNTGSDVIFWWNEDRRRQESSILCFGKLDGVPGSDEIPGRVQPWPSKNDLAEANIIFDEILAAPTGREKHVLSDCGDNVNVIASEYLESWIDWTIKFACRNEYTGYSSVKRWKSKNPLTHMRKFIGSEKLDWMKKCTLDKLKKEAGREQCPGLRFISDDKRKLSDRYWRKAWGDDD